MAKKAQQNKGQSAFAKAAAKAGSGWKQARTTKGGNFEDAIVDPGKYNGFASAGSCGVTSDDTPYAKISLTIDGGEFDGTVLHKFYSLSDSERMGYLAADLDRLGYDVSDLELPELEALMADLTDQKPACGITVQHKPDKKDPEKTRQNVYIDKKQAEVPQPTLKGKKRK